MKNTEKEFEEPFDSSVQSSVDQERAVANANGWSRLGTENINVKIKLHDDEKIASSEIIAHNEVKIIELNEKKKVFNDEIKAQISELRDQIMNHACEINLGYREERQAHPAFYDHKSNERVFVDLKTGEIVAREKARPEDRQLRIA